MTMIERILKAIEDDLNEGIGLPDSTALAVLDAMREPTEAMLAAGGDALCDDILGVDGEDRPAEVWQAMIDASKSGA